MVSIKLHGLAAIVAGMTVAGVAGPSQGAVSYHFDFQPVGETPEAGYTHVDETTAYTPELGYGLNATALAGAESRFRGTGYTTDRRVRGFLKFPTTGGGEFVVDVPNGDYLVTVVLGDPDFASVERLTIEGVTYGLLHNGGATVDPAGANVVKLITDGTGQFDKVPFEANENAAFGKVFLDPGEFLMLDQQLITVTDGQLNFVSDGFSGSNGYNLNYIDIVAVPEPATLGLSALGIGAVLLRRRRG